MRTLKNLAVPKNTDSKFPFSTIQNETDLLEGTPVVEEIYGDILTNIYKLLQSVGITPTETQDSDSSQYQILEAFKKLPNTLNDIEQVLDLTTTTWSVNFNLDLLPNKYFFVARASDNYSSGLTYNFKGTTATSYNFTSAGFKSGDELLVIIDTSGVRAYSLPSLSSEIFVSNTPIAFNDSNKIWYQQDGKLMSDVPSVADLESIIRLDVADVTILLLDVFVINGSALCFCLKPSTNDYFFRNFVIFDLNISSPVTISGASFSNASDYQPYVCAGRGVIYITNGMNTTANDYFISKFNFASGVLTFVSNIELDDSFVKTSNAVVKSGLMYTMILGVLNSFNLSTGVKVSLGNYPSVVGQIFGFNSQVYFNSGEVCKKWF